jgi:hypothetical protein
MEGQPLPNLELHRWSWELARRGREGGGEVQGRGEVAGVLKGGD